MMNKSESDHCAMIQTEPDFMAPDVQIKWTGCPTSGVAQGFLIESGALLTRHPQEKTSV
jgi:hypothetical protein